MEKVYDEQNIKMLKCRAQWGWAEVRWVKPSHASAGVDPIFTKHFDIVACTDQPYLK